MLDKMLFEVPYNFDESLLTYYEKNRKHINFLYLPPYKEDSDNTRTILQTNKIGRCYMPETRTEYEYHLRKINDMGLPFVILWQKKEHKMSLEMLEYYCSLKASGFIVASDDNAKIIKEYNCQLLVICSIVQRTCTGLLSKDLSNYDYVILYYPFNRSLNVLKKLIHIKNKLVLMPNICCDVECMSMHHWFPSDKRPFDPKKDCSMNIDNISRCGIILPQHLYLFDKYVGGYKLQGREYTTETIKYICHFYFKRTVYTDFVDPFLGREMTEKLMEMINSIPAEEYYNSKAIDIINKI